MQNKVNKVHVYTALRQKGKSTAAASDLMLALANSSISTKVIYWFSNESAESAFTDTVFHNLGYSSVSFAITREMPVQKCKTIREVLGALVDDCIVFVDDVSLKELAPLVEGVESFANVEAFITVYTENTDAGVNN